MVGGGGWWLPTHNVVKPTFTWLWLSWVLTITLVLEDCIVRGQSPSLVDSLVPRQRVIVLIFCLLLF